MIYTPKYDKKTTVEDRSVDYASGVKYLGGEVQLAMQAAVMAAYIEGYRDRKGEGAQAMSDTQERPVSQLVKDLLFWVKRDDLTDGRGPLSTDIRVLAASALEASGEREQRLRALERDGHDVDFCKILAILDGGKP
jgi:hypothetical protein